jgi:hypothetical protein
MICRAVVVRSRQNSKFTQADVFGLGSVVWVIVVLLLYASNINEDSRYLLSLFPFVGCAVCWLLVHMRSRTMLGVFAALCLLQFVIVIGQAYGAISPREKLSDYLHPYVRDDRALLDVMLCAANTSDASAEHGIFVGEEMTEFNGSALSFYRTILGSTKPSYGNIQIFSQIDAELQWLRVREGGFRYYVYRLDPSIDSDGFNRLSKPVFERIASDPEFHFRPDKSNDRMLIFERGQGGPKYAASRDQSKKTGFQGVNPEGQSPFGLLEFPKLESPEQGRGAMPVFGWVVSPSGVGRIEVLLDGHKIADASTKARTDVKQAYPTFESAGFSTKIDMNSLPEGVHEVTILAYNRAGSPRVLAKVPMVLSAQVGFQGVNPEDQLPFGLVESPNVGDRKGGEILPVFGWVVSPSGVDHIEVFVDGKHAADAAIRARQDIVKAYPSSPSAGFNVDINTSSAPEGLHQMSVVAHGKDGSSRVLAQVPVFLHTLAGFQGVNPKDRLPFGLLESPKVGDTPGGKTLPVFGWAVSPSGIDRIEVLMDGKRVADAAAWARPDVVKAYPSDPSAGFRADLNTSSVSEGRHQISIVARGKDGSSRVLAEVPVILNLK